MMNSLQTNPTGGSSAVNPRTWMNHLATHTPGWCALKLKEVIIPGTHDSLSGALGDGADSKVVGHSGIVKILTALSLPSYFVNKWTQTQHHGIAWQLDRGVRYFDMRTRFEEDKADAAYAHHGDIAIDLALSSVFNDVVRFIRNTGPNEVIMITLSHFKGHSTPAAHQKLQALIEHTFGDLLIPRSFQAPQKSMAEILESGHRVMILYHDAQITSPLAYPSSALSTNPYHDSKDKLAQTYPQLLHDYLEPFAPQQHAELGSLQAHTQTDSTYILNAYKHWWYNITKPSIEDMQDLLKINVNLRNWIVTEAPKAKYHVNIITVDMWEDAILMDAFINANVQRATRALTEGAHQPASKYCWQPTSTVHSAYANTAAPHARFFF